MGSSDTGGPELFQTECRAQMRPFRMMHDLLFWNHVSGIAARRLFPTSFQLAATVENLGRNFRGCLHDSGKIGSLFPENTKVTCRAILVGGLKIPAQENRWQGKTAQKPFKGGPGQVLTLQ